MHSGPIVIIEDDEDDQFFVKKILAELDVPNAIRFFDNGQQVLDYLSVTHEQPFIILCDINMPLMGGLELRGRINTNEAIGIRAVPFVFLTTDASPRLVQDAYEATIQGFFRKAVGYQAAKDQLQCIIGYWSHCLYP